MGTLNQLAFRGRNDDGSEAAATWIAALNTDWTQQTGVNFRVRFRVTGSAGDGSPKFRLQWNLNNGATWTDANVTTEEGNAVLVQPSTHYNDGLDCTQQLGGGGSFIADNNGMDDVDALAGPCTFTGAPPPGFGSEAEFEYCIKLFDSHLEDDDEIRLRLVNRVTGNLLDTYTEIPVITVSTPVIHIDPVPVVLTIVAPAPTVPPPDRTLLPTPAELQILLPSPTLNVGAGSMTLTPSPVVLTFSVVDPVLSLGLVPAPVVLTFAVPAPTVTGAVVAIELFPDPLALTFSVTAPESVDLLPPGAGVALPLLVPGVSCGMAIDKVGLANQALAHIGQQPIQSFNDDSKAAEFVCQQYDNALIYVLRVHPWSCATKRAVLPQLVDAPVWGWAFQYQLPDDFVRLNLINDDHVREVNYRIEGTRILSDESTMQIAYVYKLEDVRQMDSLLQDAIAARLAMLLAVPLTNDKELLGYVTQLYRSSVTEAQHVDAVEGPPEVLRNEDWVNARLQSPHL